MPARGLRRPGRVSPTSRDCPPGGRAPNAGLKEPAPPRYASTSWAWTAGAGTQEMTAPAGIILAMQQVVILELDLSSLRRAVGGGSYVRGAEYASQQAVTHATWEPEDNAMRGTV